MSYPARGLRSGIAGKTNADGGRRKSLATNAGIAEAGA